MKPAFQSYRIFCLLHVLSPHLKCMIGNQGFFSCPSFSTRAIDTWAQWRYEPEDGVEFSYQRQRIWPQTDFDWNPRFEHLPHNSSKLMLVSLFGANTLLTQRVTLNIQLNDEQKPSKYNIFCIVPKLILLYLSLISLYYVIWFRFCHVI